MRHLAIILILLCSCTLTRAEFPRYETKYYILYTDFPSEQANEVALRMTKMAEEYHTRTRDFSGEIRSKFPFYLCRQKEDYLADGGKEGTAGFFNGQALCVYGGPELDDRTWHVMQHEGFHQFAAAVIGGARPMWLDEGLAEYFGEALFTGDGFISGVAPAWRVKRLKDELRSDKLLSVDRIMNLSREEWNQDIKIPNYDQAWSMVHFLAHAENGKYQKPFAAMMMELSHGQDPQKAWDDNFGGGDGFARKWKEYWLKQPDDMSADLYVQARVARLTSFLARAAAQKQTFSSFADFRDAGLLKKIRVSPSDWLPPSLLVNALADAEDMIKSGGEFVMPSPVQIEYRKAGLRCIGTFQLQRGLVSHVDAKLVRSR